MGVLIWSRHIPKAAISPTMKKLTLATLLIFSCATAWAADFAKGAAAYDAGDFATALTEWKPLAEQGDAFSQYLLGYMNVAGQGVPQDDKEAVKWFRLAAEQGQRNAEFHLGWMLDTGTGLSEKNKEAVRWYGLAADHGDANAQIKLGNMFDKLQGMTKKGSTSYVQLLQSLAQAFQDEADYAQPRFLTDREAENYQPNDLDRLYRKALLDHCSRELGKRETFHVVPYMRNSKFPGGYFWPDPITGEKRYVNVRHSALCSGKLAPLATDKYMALPVSKTIGWKNLREKRSTVQKLLKKCFPALEQSGKVLFVASGTTENYPKACGVLVFGEYGLYVRGEVKPAKIDFSQPSFIPYSSLLLYSIPGIPRHTGATPWMSDGITFRTQSRKTLQICLGQTNNPVCQSYKFTASTTSPRWYENRLPELIAGYNEITFRKLRNIYMSFYGIEYKNGPVDGLRKALIQLEDQRFLDLLAKDNLDSRDFGTLKDKLIVVMKLQENLDEIKLLLGIEANEKTKSWSVKDDFASCQALRTIDIAYRPKVLEELKASRRREWPIPRVDLMCKSWYPEVSCFTPVDIATKDDCKSRFRERVNSVNDEFINYAQGRTTSSAIEAMKQRRDTLALHARYSYENCVDDAVSEDEAKAQRKEAKSKSMRCRADNFAANSDNRLSTQACIDSISPAIEDCMKTGRSSISLLMLEAYAANAKIARLTGPITRLETITRTPFLAYNPSTK